jgi:predicted outer membrane protein
LIALFLGVVFLGVPFMQRIQFLSTVVALITLLSAPDRVEAQQSNPVPGARQADNPTGASQPNTASDRRNSVPGSTTVGVAGQADRGRSPDAELAGCLIVDNEGEVAMGQFALQRTKNDEVKQFAQKMVEDHGKMIENLRRFAGSAGAAASPAPASAATAGTPSSSPNNAPAPSTGVQQAGTAGQPSMQNRRPNAPIDHVAFKRELGELCKQTLQRELGAKSEAEFDKCYVSQQIGAHLHAIDAMRVSQNHASPELRQALTTGIETATMHLHHAKELMKKLEGGGPGAGAPPANR